MVSEGDDDDIAHMLVSDDLMRWTDLQTGDLALRSGFDDHHKRRDMLDIRSTDGRPIEPPYGTVVVWIDENGIIDAKGTWFLFYEHKDLFINLAKAVEFDANGNPRIWLNVQDGPVIPLGPKGSYDDFEIAMDQVIRYDGHFYAFYHALSKIDQDHPLDPVTNAHNWTTCVAASDDLIHWQKCPSNPILPNASIDEKNRSSSTLIFEGRELRMYTTHPAVRLYKSLFQDEFNPEVWMK